MRYVFIIIIIYVQSTNCIMHYMQFFALYIQLAVFLLQCFTGRHHTGKTTKYSRWGTRLADGMANGNRHAGFKKLFLANPCQKLKRILNSNWGFWLWCGHIPMHVDNICALYIPEDKSRMFSFHYILYLKTSPAFWSMQIEFDENNQMLL